MSFGPYFAYHDPFSSPLGAESVLAVPRFILVDLDPVGVLVDDGVAHRPGRLDAGRHRMADAVADGGAVERMDAVRPLLVRAGREEPLGPLAEEEELRAGEAHELVLVLIRHRVRSGVERHQRHAVAEELLVRRGELG